MKNFQLFILVLLSSSITANACMYYPYGEDIRFCFFKPEYYDYYSYSEFDYSSDYFDSKELYNNEKASPNEKFWIAYCKNKVDLPDVRQAVYELRPSDFTEKSDNTMVHYLLAVKDTAAIGYLKFAKQCEVVNGFYSDPWEKNEVDLEKQRKVLIDNAMTHYRQSTDGEIKLRYAFLATRMCLYNGDYKMIKIIYDSAFAHAQKMKLVHYWELYFYSISNVGGALGSFYAAQIFANAPDKRFAAYGYFNREIPIAEVLKYANTKEEKANVYLLTGIAKSDKALDQIKEIYAIDPHNKALGFLLLREVNKIEDWVYTPYYSTFTPAVDNNYDGETKMASGVMLRRSENDRKYAKEVLDFVKTVNINIIDNPLFWIQVKAQLELAAREYNECIDTIEYLKKNCKDKQQLNQLEIVKAIAIISLQDYGKAIITDEVEGILLENKDNNKFVFTIGRELEYKGNTTDAALLYSHLNTSNSYDVFWKNKSDSEAYYDFYDNYFDYINLYYTPEQVNLLIKDIKAGNEEDKFSKWKYEILKKEINLLYDLEGVKYIRQNKLNEAMNSFKKIPTKYWDDNYGLWEKKDNNGYNVFDANPFYTLKHTPEFIPIKDSIKLNKYTVANQLIYYLKKAENTNEKNRDYYYFLVANCYRNMMQDGNCWMMRRFGGNTNNASFVVGDEEEYEHGHLAKFYYNQSMTHAKTPKFKALCLRMLGYCEGSNYYYLYDEKEYNPLDYPSYVKLKKQYPKYYDELSNCTAFADYFKARR